MGVTVRQKAPGKGKPWWVFISHQGKRKSLCVGRKSAAETVADNIQAQLRLNQYDFEDKPQRKVPTFKLYAQGFLDTYSAVNHKESTRYSYKQVLNNHLYPEFEDKPLDEITRNDIKAFIYAKSQTMSASSVRIMRSYLSAILNEAVDDELIPANPATNTGRFINSKKPKKVPQPLSWDERTKLEGAARVHYPAYYPLILTLNRTGMRFGEAVALKPGDIDFNGRFIKVQRNYVRGEFTMPKNGKTRCVDMSQQLSEALRTHITARKRDALHKGWGQPPDTLFYTDEGAPIDINNFRKRVFVKVLKKAELRHIRIHDLRHTYATCRIAAGHDITDVSKQLGHHSIKITIDTYYDWMPGTRKNEVDQLDLNEAPTCTLSAPSGKNDTKKRGCP